jgi:hypothetical protein
MTMHVRAWKFGRRPLRTTMACAVCLVLGIARAAAPPEELQVVLNVTPQAVRQGEAFELRVLFENSGDSPIVLERLPWDPRLSDVATSCFWARHAMEGEDGPFSPVRIENYVRYWASVEEASLSPGTLTIPTDGGAVEGFAVTLGGRLDSSALTAPWMLSRVGEWEIRYVPRPLLAEHQDSTAAAVERTPYRATVRIEPAEPIRLEDARGTIRGPAWYATLVSEAENAPDRLFALLEGYLDPSLRANVLHALSLAPPERSEDVLEALMRFLDLERSLIERNAALHVARAIGTPEAMRVMERILDQTIEVERRAADLRVACATGILVIDRERGGTAIRHALATNERLEKKDVPAMLRSSNTTLRVLLQRQEAADGGIAESSSP